MNLLAHLKLPKGELLLLFQLCLSLLKSSCCLVFNEQYRSPYLSPSLEL